MHKSLGGGGGVSTKDGGFAPKGVKRGTPLARPGWRPGAAHIGSGFKKGSVFLYFPLLNS
jgi:hypothetical protein